MIPYVPTIMAKPKSNTSKMKKTNRDDFSKPIVRMLREQVNNHCSNPDCGVATLGPKRGDNKANVIGKAAHICAAAPGGPRYDPAMTSKERSGIDNGIWLCANCADRIDRDEKHFTQELLHRWKQIAIARSFANLGKAPRRAIESVELYHQLHNPGGFQRTPMAQLIRRAVEVEEQALKDLDPRFDVTAEVTNGTTVFHLAPQEDDVPLQFTVSGPEAMEFARLYQRLNEHGDGFQIPLEAVKFDGSPLFDHFLKMPGGALHVGTHTKAAVHTCEIEDPETGLITRCESFAGTVHYGVKSVSFSGSACGGMLKLAYRKADPAQKQVGGLSLTFNLEQWEGKPVNHLPYLKSLVQMCDAICQGYVIRTELMVEGYSIFRGTLDPFANDPAFFSDLQAFFRYTDFCQQIAKQLGVKIPFSETVTFSDAKLTQMELILRLLKGEVIERPWPAAPIFTDLRVADDVSNRTLNALLLAPNQTIAVSCQKERYKLFDSDVELPQLHMIFTGVTAIRHSKGHNHEDDILRVEWQKQDTSHCYYTYNKSPVS